MGKLLKYVLFAAVAVAAGMALWINAVEPMVKNFWPTL